MRAVRRAGAEAAGLAAARPRHEQARGAVGAAAVAAAVRGALRGGLLGAYPAAAAWSGLVHVSGERILGMLHMPGPERRRWLSMCGYCCLCTGTPLPSGPTKMQQGQAFNSVTLYPTPKGSRLQWTLSQLLCRLPRT